MIESFGGSRGSEFFIMDFLQKIPAQALDPSGAEEALCEDIRKFTNSQVCAIVLHDEHGKISKVTLTPPDNHEFLTGDLLEKMIYVSVGTSSIKVWNIPEKKELFNETGISADIFNILSMPLYSGSTRIGTLLIVNITIAANSISLDPLFQTMDMIGKIIGLVLKNAYFYQETQEQLKLSKFMAEIGQILASSASSLAGLLQNSAEAIVSHLGVSVARIWVMDETGNTLELQASAGLYKNIDGDQSRITVGKDAMGIIAGDSMPHITNPAQTDPLINSTDWVKRDGIIAFEEYPLIAEGRVTGVLAIFSKNILTKFTIDSIATVSNSIAVAIKNKQVEKMRIQAKEEALTDKEEADRVKEVALTDKEEADRVKEVALTDKEEADRVKEVALTDKEVADRVKEAALTAKEVADRVKEAALTAKEVADRVKEAALIAKEEADRVKEAALTAKEEADRVKEAALIAKEEADRVKEEALIAKKEADRVKEAALIAKEEADRVKEEALIAKKEADRVKEEALIAKKEADRVKEAALIAKEEADRVKEAALIAKEEADRVKEAALIAKEEADRVKEAALIAKEEADRVKEAALIAKEEADRAKAEAVIAKEVAARAMEEVVIAKEEAETAREVVVIAKEEADRAKEEAERANKSKSDFLSNMSHEIRTPMNAIIGLTDIVLERILDEKQKDYLLIVKSSANSLLSTINGILDIMKIESGKFELETVDFSINAVVASAIDMFLITAPKKGILIKYDISPEVPSVLKGDPTRLRQVLINLIGNALKFTLKGEINVGLKVIDGQNQEATVNLLFSVQDTGIGIARDRKETIFKRFTQADSSTTREYGGTGLGLTINKEFVNLMGGSMWVESELGVGSTFFFTVIMEKTDKKYVLSTEEIYDQHRHILLARPRRKFRILVVEDIEENILLLNIRLQQYGHTVIIARNGLEAVECFKSNPVDVILMDVQMPVMDGLEATRQIRKLESSLGGRITIIALTASVMREEKASYIRNGVDAVVEKPIEIENLLSTIELTVRGGIGEMNTDLIVEKGAVAFGEFALIDGIDVKKGISVWKDADAYKKALMGFSRKYGSAADTLLSLIEGNDIDGAYRLSHSLDGVSGNLSIVHVFKVARELSHSLKDRNLDNARTQLGQLKELLKKVVDSISKIHVPESAVINHKRELDSSVLKGLILRLIESCESEEPDEAEPILYELHGVITAEQEESIKRYIEDLDFDGAKEQTLKLSLSLGIDLEA